MNINTVKTLSKNQTLKSLILELSALEVKLSEVGPKVDKVYNNILTKYKFIDVNGLAVTDYEDLYMSDMNCDEFYAEANRKLLELYPETKEGLCPKLCITSEITRVECAIHDLVTKTLNFPETWDLEIRKQILDLTRRFIAA